jgi:hypothetical protein
MFEVIWPAPRESHPLPRYRYPAPYRAAGRRLLLILDGVPPVRSAAMGGTHWSAEFTVNNGPAGQWCCA